ELAVRAYGPRSGEVGDRRLAVPVERHQRVLDHVDDVGGRAPGRALCVVVRRVASLHHVEGLRRRGTGYAERQCRTREGPDHCCSLGARTSRSASPRRLAASTMTKITRLGIVAMCGAMNRKSRPWAAIMPSSAVGGCAPMPRKPSAEPIRMIWPKRRVRNTKMVEMQFKVR